MEIVENEKSSYGAGKRQWDIKCIRIFAVLSIGIGLVCTVLSGVVLLSQYSCNENSKSADRRMDSALSVVQMFPGYFRTPAEQEEYERFYRSTSPKVKAAALTDTFNKSTCSVGSKCMVSPNVSRRYLYHGCCSSQTILESPQYVISVTGIKYRLARFNGWRQYYPSEICIQAQDCDTCFCASQTAVTTGVAEEKGNYFIIWFFINGCCKCLNTIEQ